MVSLEASGCRPSKPAPRCRPFQGQTLFRYICQIISDAREGVTTRHPREIRHEKQIYRLSLASPVLSVQEFFTILSSYRTLKESLCWMVLSHRRIQEQLPLISELLRSQTPRIYKWALPLSAIVQFGVSQLHPYHQKSIKPSMMQHPAPFWTRRPLPLFPIPVSLEI